VPTFKDKNVLVCGAGRGIGKRLAMGFANAGARVGILARSKAELDLLNLEIEHGGGRSLRLRADIRDYRQVVLAVDRMTQEYGSVEAVVCASGTLGPIGPLAGCDPSAWADALMTGVTGPMHVARAVLPQMIERRSGKLLFLAGPGAEAPRPRFSAYAAANTALVRLVETLAEEVLEANVQVNCLNPGPTYTSMTDEILQAGEKLAGSGEYNDAVHVRTSGGTPPDRQMQMALFLTSERSNHISGKLISVTDDWRRLEQLNSHTELYTLRRLQRV
jgi:NAD(P)-dependent dehydrogenase (short-subunit alcohol dehydrogenase family)